MPITERQYDTIQREYSRKQAAAKRAQQERIREAFEKAPGLKAADEAVADLYAGRARAKLEGDEAAAGRFAEQIREARLAKREALARAGFPADYLDLKYECPLCGDTGYADGRKCVCRRQAESRLMLEESGIASVLARENFGTFTFDYFDRETVNPATGLTPYEQMQRNHAAALRFVERFGSEYRNLLFAGQTGTGKTFLSNCIAAAVLEKGFSVRYFTAGGLFADLSRRWEGLADALLESDLLVLDDLGTEYTNGYVNEKLFYLLNERDLRRRATILSTNLDLDGLTRTYTERISSRLIEKYDLHRFYNGNIRIIKRQKLLKGG